MIKKSKEHLKKTNESYFKHMQEALVISFELLISCLMAFIHALLPSFFTTSASNKIKKLNAFIENRSKNK